MHETHEMMQRKTMQNSQKIAWAKIYQQPLQLGFKGMVENGDRVWF